MALSDVTLRKAKAAEKPYRITDGDGLYVIIRPNGAKWWRFDYRINGKRKTMSFGTYPEISLADARARREAARKLVANGSDPVEKERQERRDKTAEAENTFGAIAEEYIERLRSMGRAPGTITQAEWHLRKLSAKLSDEPIREITSAKILDVLKHIESSGRIETAHKVRSSIGSVSRLAISTLRAENDPTVALRGAIRPRVDEPRAAITNEREFGGCCSPLTNTTNG